MLRWGIGLAALVGLLAIGIGVQGQGLPQMLMYGVFNGAPRALSVDTNGNLNISASISGADGAILDGVSSAVRATVQNLAGNKALAVSIQDGTGTQITSFGGGTQYANGAVQATPTGTVALGWDGTNVRALNTNASGSLNVIFPSAQAVNATQAGTWTVQPGNTANTTAWLVTGTGGTFPATQSGTWNTTDDTELPAAAAAADAAANPTAPFVQNALSVFNGTTWDRWREAVNATNSTGTGLAAVVNLLQFDDVSPTAITENQFGNARMSANRNAYMTIRDAAGNERGVNVTAGNALVVDGSAVTQPVSLAANQSVNVAQINGVTTTMGNGVSGTGVQRVTLASDSTGQVTLATGTNTIGALTANQSVNVAQMNGVATTMGNGVAGTGVQRVALASDNSAVSGLGAGATGAAPPANGVLITGLIGGATGGFTQAVPVCDQQAFLNMTTATTTEIVPLTASRTVHICHFRLMANGTTTATFKRGTGTNCGTGTTAIDADYNLTAQVGFATGSGFGEVLSGSTSGNAVCLTNSAAVNLQAFVRYAVY